VAIAASDSGIAQYSPARASAVLEAFGTIPHAELDAEIHAESDEQHRERHR
jgi:hypothetical protein